MKFPTPNITKTLLYIVGVLVLFWPWVDYFDLGVWPGINIFKHDQDLAAVVTWFVGFPTLGTLYIAIQAFREQQRQRELDTRPYLRLAWDSGYVGQNRLSQGITDSCLIAVNEGKGHMRNVRYQAKVGGKMVGLRRHEFIKSGGQTMIVYNDLSNESGPALGNRNDVNFPSKNDEIIKAGNIEIWGTYQDWTGTATYQFKFVSDPTSQSGLSEPGSQRRI